MKNKITLLPLLALALSTQVSLAQAPAGGGPGNATAITGTAALKGNSRITGTVVDATNQQPVGFATITLADPNTGKPLDGALADDKGKFTIAKIGPGNYRVIISFIGYETRNIDGVKINDRNDDVNLGAVKINTSATALKEVQVQGQRAIIEEKVDRTVYNAENDMSNRGGDATDVLRKVPMLSVDLDGNVSMRGSSNLRVLINNRPSTITAGSVADALKQIPADLIKSVEVITSPSAKYDAEGSAGIINIVLKKNTLQGGNLNIDAGAGLRGSNLGLNGSYKKGKMGFSLGGFGRAMYNSTGSFLNTQITKDSNGNPVTTNIQEADTRNSGMFGRYTFGWDYDINKNNFLSTSIQYGIRNGHNFQDNLTGLRIQNDESFRSLRDVEVTDNSGTVDVNVNYTHTFDKPQQEFSILTQYSRNNRTNNFFNDIFNSDFSTIDQRLKNINESFNQESTIQIDYQNPIGKNQLVELGGKQIVRQVTSDYETFNAIGANGPFVKNPNAVLSNIFNYNQNVTGGYLSYTLTTPSQFSFKTGARYEYTTITADFKTSNNGEVKIPAYGVLVPSINLSKRLKEGNTVKVSYNRRIQRPSLQFLNPNPQAPNPLSVTIGNQYLDPEYTNNFELAYSTYINRTSLNFSTYYRNTNNAIQSIRDTVANPLDYNVQPGAIRTTFQNIGQEDAYGISLFGNINISDKLSLNAGTDSYYSVLDNNVSDPNYRATNKGWVFNIRGMGNYTLGKGWGLQGFGFYRARQVQLQGTQGGFGIYSLNFRKFFNDKKGTIGFGAENFFGTSIKMVNELESPLLSQKSTNVMNNLSFRATFSYRLGKVTTDANRRRRKSVNNDDMKSGGDGNGQEAAGGAPAAASPAGGGMPTGGAPVQGQGQMQRPAGAPGQFNRPVNPAGAPQTTAPGTQTTPDSAAVGQPANATGTWQGRMGQFDLTLKLAAEGETLTGSVVTPRGESPITDGKITGSDLSFNLSFGPNKIPYRGRIQGDQLSLQATFQGQPVEAVLNRVK
ncbi:outer membrane beta-barrel family protein [Adhaeribacter rhizoryzae]|uniref:TonB-dependent receptor n=1 Tax=Adhaeribacter rhizoryzae TaxID=2607907 RepID=A0A5M6DNZ2_9BACT|nr:outer membrane beta-barrel family protein [Adhaeribacter rhizoryzae]KAA5547962.1 TonB-dependent receptor [Adhaeribacter rhizoryzae]